MTLTKQVFEYAPAPPQGDDPLPRKTEVKP